MSNNVCTVKVFGCDLQQDDVVVYRNQLMLVYLLYEKLKLAIIDTTERRCREWYTVKPEEVYYRVTIDNIDIESIIDIRADS